MTKSRKQFTLTAAAFLSAAFAVWGQVSFENPDLNAKNQMLFTVNTDIPGSPVYSTAFMSDVSKEENAKILTCYPEKLELLCEGAVLQVRNRYGTARYSVSDQSLAYLSRAASVSASSIRQENQSVSPDGKWICFVRKTSLAGGQLILRNASTLAETILNPQADFSYESVPVIWSSDSENLVYEKGGAVYFCEPKAAFSKVQLGEEFRRIGPGTIRSVSWANSKVLMYIDHDVVYRVSANELYTRGLYAPLVGSGVVVGRLPIAFDAVKDRFWVNPEGDSLLVIQSDKVISTYSIKNADSQGFLYLPAQYSKPFADPRGSVIGFEVFWKKASDPLIWVDIIALGDGSKKSTVYTISSSDNTLNQLSMIDDSGKPVASPDGNLVAFSAGESLYVYTVPTWKMTGRLTSEKQVSYVWASNDSMYVGGVSTVSLWKRGDAERKVLFLSSARNAFWRDDGTICAQDGAKDGIFYEYEAVRNTWKKLPSTPEVRPSVQNGRYRVFVGSAANPLFKNAVYVRTLAGSSVTRPLFSASAEKTAARKKIALAFDALDSADGLARILSVLQTYRVKGTFFLNGEFIRRYPAEAKQIAISGYECASMFFTSADLTKKGFVVDEEFIRRGLARNEDEFFAATGCELSLYWHAAGYHSNARIKAAGEKAGYRYVEAAKNALDTQTLEKAVLKKENYFTASQIISYFCENASDGTIIPVSTGIATGSRSDYLYEKLDLLISSLLDSGYEIVSVRDLM